MCLLFYFNVQNNETLFRHIYQQFIQTFAFLVELLSSSVLPWILGVNWRFAKFLQNTNLFQPRCYGAATGSIYNVSSFSRVRLKREIQEGVKKKEVMFIKLFLL